MKNSVKIFKRDIKNIFTNSMAIILAVGIAVLPSLYAWFNIFANWDPYGSTGNMQVAVIIEDEGYKFRDIEIDVGSEIESNLKANKAIDWQFVSKKEAMEGVEAGKYYAAIEIPKGFSKSLTSIVTDKFKQPQITYYANEKKNAIATKITDKVVQTVQQEVNESFVTTVINIVSSLIDVVAEATENGALDTFEDLQNKLKSASASIDSVQKTVDGFGSIIELSETLNDAINSKNLDKLGKDSKELINNTEDMVLALQKSINSITSSVDKSLVKISDGANDTATLIAGITNLTEEKAAEPIAQAQSRLTNYKAQLEAIRDTLESVQGFLPNRLPVIDDLIKRLNTRINKVSSILADVNKLKGGAAKTEVDKIVGDLRTLSSDLDSMKTDYKKNVQPEVDKTLSSLIDVLRVTGSLISDLNGDMKSIRSLAGSINGAIESGEDLVKAIDKLLNNIKKELNTLSDKIAKFGDSEIFNTIKNTAGTNSEQLGAFLACPVIVNTDKVYGIENYGSAMAPFYTTLAIWVGTMFLVAVVKTAVKRKKEIGKNVRIYQAYFGRLMTYLLFSVVQSTIICCGDLYFLKIQCYHPFKFILAGVVAAVAFTVFVYSLAFTFGDIGKSIAIIFLVIQIGGSGGTFPIDVTPPFFQALHPYLPFTYVVNAMRECVCGTYANDYWIDLLKLSAYIGVGLIIGLGVKFLVKKPIRFFEKRVEKTGIF